MTGYLLNEFPKPCRKKLWEVSNNFHCSIIGTCLAIDETRRILLKNGMKISRGAPDYEVHSVAVTAAGSQNPVSGSMTKTIDSKFGRILKLFPPSKDDNFLFAQWNECFENGDIPGAYWAIMSHPASSDELKWKVFGEVHMLSHLNGSSSRAVIEELRLSRIKCDRLENEKRNYRRTINDLNARLEKNATFLLERGRINEEILRLTAIISEISDSNKEKELRLEIENYRECLNIEKGRMLKYENRIQSLENRITGLNEANASLRKELHCSIYRGSQTASMIQANIPKALNDGTIRPDCCLKGKCVLYVGGKSAAVTHCRKFVEEVGGRFLYHDGGVEDNIKQLPGAVKSTDVVFCPVDCVSHNACHILKKICKRHGKRFVMLRSSGLTSFSKSIQDAFEGNLTAAG